jgi:hypothetical protein
LMIVLSSCKVEPDFTKNGHDYVVIQNCVKSHDTTKYDYHYGFNMLNSKFEWHIGYYNETICDSIKLDTVEVNINK